MHTNTGARQFRFASEIEYGEVDEKRSHVPPPSRSERIAEKKVSLYDCVDFFLFRLVTKIPAEGQIAYSESYARVSERRERS